MSMQNDPKKWARAHTVLKQQLDGALQAAMRTPLRVPKGAWRRGGGRAGTTASSVTHMEAAHTNFVRGRDRALGGGFLTARESESYWCKFGYYSTLSVLELLGDRVDTALIPTPVPAPAEAVEEDDLGTFICEGCTTEVADDDLRIVSDRYLCSECAGKKSSTRGVIPMPTRAVTSSDAKKVPVAQPISSTPQSTVTEPQPETIFVPDTASSQYDAWQHATRQWAKAGCEGTCPVKVRVPPRPTSACHWSRSRTRIALRERPAD
jgi:hypothetical protein